jgi:hypothetical protein
MVKTMRRYSAEMLLAMAAYVVVLCGSLAIVKRFEMGSLKYAVVLAPMLPCAFALSAVVRALGRVDELQRKIQLEALAIAFGATAFLTFAYGFLEGAGLPHLSWIWVWPLMGGLWMVGIGIAKSRYR